MTLVQVVSNSLGAFLLLLLALPATSQTFPAGSGSLSGRGQIAVKGCDKFGGTAVTSYELDATGVFTEEDAIVGTATPMGGSGRLFTISYDAANTAIIEDLLAEAASLLCQSTVSLTSSQISATLKFNKRGTRASVRQRATFSGTDSQGRSRVGRLKAKDRGAWTPAT